MIDSYLRNSYQKHLMRPILRVYWIQKLSPHFLTAMACFTGLISAFCISTSFPKTALVFLLLSGFLDTLDGSVARAKNDSKPSGAAIDICSDRLVEWGLILGLYFVDPLSRSFYSLLMLGSILLCITSFLVVGIFSQNISEKSFHYSPGMIERTEAFIFFALMILFPTKFIFFSLLFSLLVLTTACIRIVQYIKTSSSSLQKLS